MADASILQVVWPGVSTLLGAVVGGGATYLVNRQKSEEEREGKRVSRQNDVRDRSFYACVDFLKASRVVTTEAKMAAWAMSEAEPPERVSQYSVEREIRNLYATVELGRMTIPVGAQEIFQEYTAAVLEFCEEVDGWMAEYLADPSPSIADRDRRYAKCSDLEDAALEKCDKFTKVAKQQFDEGVWA